MRKSKFIKNSFQVEFLHSFSSSGNNQFIILPFRVSRKPFCDFINSEYRKYFMNDMHKVSKLPYTENDDEDLCQQFQVIFR